MFGSSRRLVDAAKFTKLYLEALGFLGLIRALLASATGITTRITMLRTDCKFPFLLRVPSSDVPTYRQVFIDQDYALRAASPPKVIVDAGANIGLAAIYFANRFPEARIIAIEPEAGNFEIMKANVRPYANVVPVQAALWGTNGEISVFDPKLGNWGYMTGCTADEESPPGAAVHTVTAFTVDRVMQEFGLERIDILKIDIEGAEREVFANASAWISRVDTIIAELHDRMKVGCSRSFFLGTPGFDHEWWRGENVYLSRGNCLPMAQG
jgi:FkbM family methyltransferase